MNRLLEYRDLWLIGGGGKTTLMFKCASAWAARGERVICTTTTRIWKPTPDQCPDLRIGTITEVLASLRERPSPRVTVAARLEEGKPPESGDKCHGFSAEEALLLKQCADRLVVEADGSAGRPVKAHKPHEPVLPADASCVVAVVGGWCVGAPLDAEHVHRPELFAALSGRGLGETVTAEDAARVILGDQGWIRAVPPGAAFHLVVTGEENGIIDAVKGHPGAGRLSGLHRSQCIEGKLVPHR